MSIPSGVERRSGRRASVRGRRGAAAGWRTQARGVDLRNALARGGVLDEDDVTLCLAVPDAPTRGGGRVCGRKAMSAGSGMNRFWVEGLVVEPHAMEDDGEPAGECGGGLPGADAAHEGAAPGLEARGGLDAVEDGHGGLEEQGAHHGVAAFADAAAIVGLARLITAWRQPEMRADIGGMSEAVRVVDRRLVAERGHGADARCGHEQTADRVLANDREDLAMQLVEGGDERAAGLQHGRHDGLEHRLAGDELAGAADLAELEAEGLE